MTLRKVATISGIALTVLGAAYRLGVDSNKLDTVVNTVTEMRQDQKKTLADVAEIKGEVKGMEREQRMRNAGYTSRQDETVLKVNR